MAMANVARWYQLQGLRVVMIDWDLEAPGLESYFGHDPAELDVLRSKLGLLDLIVAYKDIFTSLPIPARRVAPTSVAPILAPDGLSDGTSSVGADAPAVRAAEKAHSRAVLEILDETLPPLSHMLVPIKTDGADPGGLWLLPAGARNGAKFNSYAETVQGFDWADFYANYEGEMYFEWLRLQLLKESVADVALIDSRTGVAEMSGVCTRQLADLIVILCAPNDQNLEGVARMAQSFTRADLIAARDGRPIEMLMVPARLDVSEGRPVDLFVENFRAKLEPFAPVFLRRLGIWFSKLRIPYISAYAYAERLAVGDPEGVSSLQDAYITLAAHIAALATPGSQLKAQSRSAIQQTFGLPTVHVISIDDESAEHLPRVQEVLDGAGLLTLASTDKAEAVLDSVLQARTASALPPSLLVVVGSAALAAPRTVALYRRAREQGVSMLFASATDLGPETARPLWTRRVRIYDYLKDMRELVGLLQTPRPAQRVPLMAPPAPAVLVGRAAESKQLKELLLSGATADGTPSPIALIGTGGIGKSAVARTVCRDEEVVDCFDGGILWAKVGPEGDLQTILTGFIVALCGETSSKITTPDEAVRQFKESLTSRHCLVVLDSITDPAAIVKLLPAMAGSQLLITTRARDVAAEIRAVAVDIGPLTPEAAGELARLQIDQQAMGAAAVEELTGLLGSVPLAIEVASTMLRTRIQLGEVPSSAPGGHGRENSRRGAGGGGIRNQLKELHDGVFHGVHRAFGILGADAAAAAGRSKDRNPAEPRLARRDAAHR